MSDVIRVRGNAVVSLATDMAWRSKLYGWLSIGLGVLIAAWTIMTAMTELQYETGQDYNDALAGVAVFVVLALAAIGFGFTRLKRAGQLSHIVLRAQLNPEADWIVLGREVRSTDPMGTGAPPLLFSVNQRAREQLVRGTT